MDWHWFMSDCLQGAPIKFECSLAREDGLYVVTENMEATAIGVAAHFGRIAFLSLTLYMGSGYRLNVCQMKQRIRGRNLLNILTKTLKDYNGSYHDQRDRVKK
jgi:hypothetical protein